MIPSMPSPMDQLRERFPWPVQAPASVTPVDWVMDYGGRELIREIVRNRKFRIIVEVGVFVGGSVRQWLQLSPDLVVVAIDPWPQIKGTNHFYDTHPVGRHFGSQLRETDGLYHSFLATLWNDRHRVIPMRGIGIEMLPYLHSLGVRPDLIFIDADKQGAEIRLCDELFPEAVICGDDWLWCDGYQFPCQKPVCESARWRQRVLKCVSNTWVIDKQPWSMTERLIWLRGLPISLIRQFTAWRRSLRGLDSSGNPVA